MLIKITERKKNLRKNLNFKKYETNRDIQHKENHVHSLVINVFFLFYIYTRDGKERLLICLKKGCTRHWIHLRICGMLGRGGCGKGNMDWVSNFMDTKAKCRHLKKLPVKGLWAGVYLTETSSPPMTPYPPPYTLIRYTVYLSTQGRGGELHREKVRGAPVHIAGFLR
jgi:hypothetical protein